MAHQLGRDLILFSATIGALVGCGKPGTNSLKPQTKLVSSALAIPVDMATAPFRIELGTGQILGSEVSPEQAADFSAILVREYSIYPSNFFRATQLKRCVLCRNLSFDAELRAAIPDFENNDLYFDVERGSHDQFYQRHFIHHELFHVVDWRDDGELYEDQQWKKLNSDLFYYGIEGTASQSDELAGNLQDGEAGFLTRYSMTGVEEDKAELFSFLILSPKLVEQRATRDRVLAGKVVRMKTLLIKFCPKLDDTFWRQVEASDRGLMANPM